MSSCGYCEVRIGREEAGCCSRCCLMRAVGRIWFEDVGKWVEVPEGCLMVSGEEEDLK